MHDFTHNRDEDTVKYRRRIERLCQILDSSSEPIIFIRKGHATHQHGAHEGRFDTITNDLMDVNRLDSLLTTKYRKLNYNNYSLYQEVKEKSEHIARIKMVNDVLSDDDNIDNYDGY